MLGRTRQELVQLFVLPGGVDRCWGRLWRRPLEFLSCVLLVEGGEADGGLQKGRIFESRDQAGMNNEEKKSQ